MVCSPDILVLFQKKNRLPVSVFINNLSMHKLKHRNPYLLKMNCNVKKKWISSLLLKVISDLNLVWYKETVPLIYNFEEYCAWVPNYNISWIILIFCSLIEGMYVWLKCLSWSREFFSIVKYCFWSDKSS